MDGAAKFVRGDAIAGLLITFINLVGGLIIGVGQMGVSFAEAAHTYTLLTVGDGLVSQIPALVVSTAAGLLVSKAGVAGAHRPRPVRPARGASPGARHHERPARGRWRSLPGLPLLPFLTLAGGERRARLAPGPARARGDGSHSRACRQPLRSPKSRSAPRSRWTRSGSSSATACCR